MEQAPSFDVVAKQLSGALLGYLQRYLGDRHAAEDVLQETLLRIARALPEFERRASVKTWAFKIATNAAIDYLRRSKSAALIVPFDEKHGIPGEDEGTDDRMVIEEMNACIREEIDSLPETYRAAILLHDLEGLTAAQTAEATGCSLANAKVRIRRARARLQQALARDCTFYSEGEQPLRCDRKDPRAEA